MTEPCSTDGFLLAEAENIAEHPHIESHERLDTWRIIPVRKWLITMVSKSPKVGQRSPSKIH